MDGCNCKTGLRNRCFMCDSEYHPAPRCPWRDSPRGDGRPFSPERARSKRPPYSPISMGTPVLSRTTEKGGESETGSKCEQSFVTSVVAGAAFMVPPEDSAAVLDTGAPANPVCSSWLARQNRILGRPIHPKQDSALVMDAWGRYAMRQMFQWGSLGIGACSLCLCWMGAFQRYCGRAL